MTTATSVSIPADRKASARELKAIRRLILGPDGIGIEKAAARIGKSTGYLSRALRGLTKTPLMLSDLRKLRQANGEESA